jgi:hypothetical protein
MQLEPDRMREAVVMIPHDRQEAAIGGEAPFVPNLAFGDLPQAIHHTCNSPRTTSVPSVVLAFAAA